MREGLSGWSDPSHAGGTPVKALVKMPVKTSDRVLSLLAENPELTLTDVAKAVGKSLPAVLACYWLGQGEASGAERLICLKKGR